MHSSLVERSYKTVLGLRHDMASVDLYFNGLLSKTFSIAATRNLRKLIRNDYL